MMGSSLCEVPGLRIGHAHDDAAQTGCTVILPSRPAVAGVDVRGSAPGTREIELLHPIRLVQEIHAIYLTGGSAFGLNGAGGVQRYLEEREIGFETGFAKVPIVPAAVIFDLGVGSATVRPDTEMAYRACQQANDSEAREGLVGAGRGATVGKIRGMQHCMRGGVGMVSWRHGEVVVAALVVVNALGDIVDPKSGSIIAGAKDERGNFTDTCVFLKTHPFTPITPFSNTTLAVIATNARFNRSSLTKIAQMANDGFARAISPAHTFFDGDVVFMLSCGDETADVTAIGVVAAELTATAIVRAVQVSNNLTA